jgi:glucose/arabinose dehydrogenase
MPRLIFLLVTALVLGACSDSHRTSQASPPATTVTQRPTTAAPPGSATTPARRAASGSSTAHAQAAPFDPNAVSVSLDVVAQGFSQPTFVTSAGDGSGRLFVVEKQGSIRVIANGAPLPDPFLDIRSLVGSSGTEQGLLGLAFHPHFAENGRFFVMYTANNAPNGDNTIAEYHVSSDPNRADPNSGRVLLAIPDFAPNHNGGMLAFGPDGYLYAGTGDGGGAGDPQRNGQNLQALLGKLLRLDVDGGAPYAIPPDNPFAGRQDARPEIWAYGLRNPWRFSFDRATNDLWIADVGQNNWEEIDFQPAGSPGGQNYGWSIMEGMHCFRPATNCDQTGLTPPVAEYGHDLGCSITGGYVYRGQASPALTGVYLYGDYCSGRIWALYQTPDGAYHQAQLLQQNIQISSFGEDEAGEVYVAGLDTGTIYRLTAQPK